MPCDFALGTLAEEDSTILMMYDRRYTPGFDRGFRFDDAKVNVDWELPSSQIHVAEKDLLLPSFSERGF